MLTEQQAHRCGMVEERVRSRLPRGARAACRQRSCSHDAVAAAPGTAATVRTEPARAAGADVATDPGTYRTTPPANDAFALAPSHT
jgi:hypothetical protein